MKVTLHGAGYVGLVTAACLASGQHDVVCVDANPARVADLNAGIIPIYEPGLAALVHEGRKSGLLRFTADVREAVEHGDFQFIAVGTPQGDDGSADLQHVLEVARTIGRHMNRSVIVVDKSTVPVGTGERVERAIASELEDREQDIEFFVCSNPEFLKEGSAIADFLEAPRIVVGSSSAYVCDAMRDLYAPFVMDAERMIFMERRAAELSKYAANAMLALKISFINEIAALSERLGVDVAHVREAIGSDPRIGHSFISPGCGYGGSCLPKDISALAHTAETVGRPSALLAAVHAINEGQKSAQFEKLERALGSIGGRTIAVWGLSFKPRTDDVRYAPALTLIDKVLAAGGVVQAYDPKAAGEIRRIYGERPDLALFNSASAAVVNADALVICTDWDEFRSVHLPALAGALTTRVVVDGRNLFDPGAAQEAGLSYFGVGCGLSLEDAEHASNSSETPHFQQHRRSMSLDGAGS